MFNVYRVERSAENTYLFHTFIIAHFARKINTDYSAADASASGDAAADDEEKGRS